jgi:hypothetical protein
MAKKPLTKNVPAKTSARVVGGASSGSPPAHLAGYQSSGAGVPTDQGDFLIPMARVLDAKSPEVEKRGPNYVQGAEAGDIFIKNGPIPLIKGDEGFLFQPVYRDQAIVEWLPRTKGGGGGGGFVARHPVDFLSESDDVEQRSHPENKEKRIWVRKSSGNLLVDTRYVGGFMIAEDAPPLPLVLPFQSTGHTVAKGWNMKMAQKRINGAPADIWLVYYRVTSQHKSRGDQSWFLFSIADAGEDNETMWCPTAEDVIRGRQLYDSLNSGARRMADEDAVEE